MRALKNQNQENSKQLQQSSWKMVKEKQLLANTMCQSILTWNNFYDSNHNKNDKGSDYLFCWSPL